MNLGFRVAMRVCLQGNEFEQTLRNVTEIHFCYPDWGGNRGTQRRIAFESDIHGTGLTYTVEQVLEFEAKAETEQASSF